MRLILEYGKFIAKYEQLKLFIKGQSPIIFNFKKTEEKERLVRRILKEIYGDDFNKDPIVEYDGVELSSELLNKAQKNITILYEIVYIAKSIGNRIQTADDLMEFIKSQKDNLFKPSGRFFDRIYSRLGKVTEKGKEKEEKSDKLFNNYAATKGVSVDLKSPTSSEDIGGIDSFFHYNGKKYTIQTKTLSSIKEDGDFYVITISGSYTEIKTDYFILIPKDSGKKYIFKGKNVKLPDMLPRVISSKLINFYYVPKDDLLYVED